MKNRSMSNSRRRLKVKLYRVECISELNFSATNWTKDLHEVKKNYEQKKTEMINGLVRLVTIEI